MRIQTLSIVVVLFGMLVFSGSATAFNCNVNATGVNFGGYDVFSSTPRDATGSIQVDCNIPAKNPHAPLMVTISISPGNSGLFAQRTLQGPGSVLNYNLYTSPSFSTVWGDGSSGSDYQTVFVTRESPWTGIIYGRIPARQNVPAGIYDDLLIVTVEW
jgi:spore coat protein U domain-containing protein, fimbrial subunit CupE1/2/3/6